MKKRNLIKILIFGSILLAITFNIINVKAAKETTIKPAEYSNSYKKWISLSEEEKKEQLHHQNMM